jgi:enterobactin synthetase component F
MAIVHPRRVKKRNAAPVAVHFPTATSSDVSHLLRERCLTEPTATVARFGDEILTAEQLETRVALVASALRQLGVRSGSAVGLCVNRDLDMPVAWHAVLRAGAALVPLDPAYPQDRLAYILADSGVRVIVGHRDRMDQLPLGDISTLAIDESLWQSTPDVPLMDPLPGDPSRPAYIIYTSGSTGKPKGVVVTHRSLNLLVESQIAAYDLDELRVVGGTTSLSFDLSIPEMTVPLVRPGASLRILGSGLDFAAPDCGSDITLLHLVPSVLGEILRLRKSLPPQVKTVTLCGEPLTRQLAEQTFAAQPGVRLRNLYGPTEATVYVTGEDVIPGEDGPPPIGRAFPGVDVHIVDADLRPVPDGEWGELGLAGDWLAQGYHGQPALTAERFAPADWVRGGRLYRTGDYARRRPDQRLEVSGRLDNQVKVRGFRIELEEVESALTAVDGIGQACVVLSGQDSAARLIAYVAGDGTGSTADLMPSALRAQAARRLPPQMVPSVIVIEDTLPRQPNGKIDRNALRRRAESTTWSADTVADLAPDLADADDLHADPIAVTVGRCMAELLQLTRPVRPQQSFFDVGGTSLLGVRLLVEIDRFFGVKLPVQTLMTATTPQELSDVLRDAGATLPEPCAVLRQGTGRPLFLLAGWFGQFLRYRALAQEIDTDRPIVGICPQTRTDRWDFTPSVAELAARSIMLIRQLQPEGPVLLGGHSFGGMLAYEVGCQLELAGEPVESLILIDGAAPIRGLKRAWIEARRLRSGSPVPAQLRDAIRRELTGLVTRGRGCSASPAPEQPGAAPSGAGASVMGEIEQIDTANASAMHGWRPIPFKGDALLFRTAEWMEERGDSLLGFRGLIHGRLETVDVSGGHLEILVEPQLQEVSIAMTQWMGGGSRRRPSGRT